MESTQNSAQPGLRRLLIDLEFKVDGLDYDLRLGEYFISWYNGSSLNLCSPSQYQWNRWVDLNFVFLEDCHENQTVWVNYFIENMAELLATTLDVNIKVIVTTCDKGEAPSYDLRLRSSGFDRFAVVVLDGVYSESRAMNAALSEVEDGNSIVVLCNSRLKLPTMIVEEIRKVRKQSYYNRALCHSSHELISNPSCISFIPLQHTFMNTMAYSPVPFQLDCGYFPGSEPFKGEWCPECGGLLALFKRDWNMILTDEHKEFLRSYCKYPYLRFFFQYIAFRPVYVQVNLMVQLRNDLCMLYYACKIMRCYRIA